MNTPQTEVRALRGRVPQAHLLRALMLCFSGITLFLPTTEAAAQGIIGINFNGSPQQPPGTSYFIQQYYEYGMWFQPIGGVTPDNGFAHRRGGGQASFFPDNGSAYIATALGDSLMFSYYNGAPFNLHWVQLAEYSTVVPDAVTVNFIGYRPDGSTVTAQFTTDGIIDGSGPLTDFELFSFPPEFAGVQRLRFPATAGRSIIYFSQFRSHTPEYCCWSVGPCSLAGIGEGVPVFALLSTASSSIIESKDGFEVRT